MGEGVHWGVWVLRLLVMCMSASPHCYSLHTQSIYIVPVIIIITRCWLCPSWNVMCVCVCVCVSLSFSPPVTFSGSSIIVELCMRIVCVHVICVCRMSSSQVADLVYWITLELGLYEKCYCLSSSSEWDRGLVNTHTLVLLVAISKYLSTIYRVIVTFIVWQCAYTLQPWY